MCGEKIRIVFTPPRSIGSPPHVRGKVTGYFGVVIRIRITPACAGKSFFCPDRILWDRDHPRMCGEKNAIELELIRRGGSPPHVRGKVACRKQAPDKLGITPACAGKSIIKDITIPADGDHPRMCGEKSVMLKFNNVKMGSPPHVRGKDIINRAAFDPSRITPACAGKSLPSLSFAQTYWDHPRMCGEKWPQNIHEYHQMRITPACAGKRFPSFLPAVHPEDHPRMCGEKTKKIP